MEFVITESDYVYNKLHQSSCLMEFVITELDSVQSYDIKIYIGHNL